MEERKRVTLSELKVGIFVIVASIILAVGIFTIGSQVGLLEETFTAKTYLNNVSGLKPGDIVLLGGVEVGNVVDVGILEPEEMPDTVENRRQLEAIRRLEPDVADARERLEASRSRLDQLRQQLAGVADPAQQAELRLRINELQEIVAENLESVDRAEERLQRARRGLQNIVVTLDIQEAYRDWIRRDSSISLGSVGLLGDKYVEISLGRSSDPPIEVVESVETWFADAQRRVVLITGRPQAGFQELITGANDILANFETLSERLREITDTFQEGQGTIGKIFTDPSLYDNLNDAVLGARSAVSSAAELLDKAARGEGTIAQLIQNRELYDQVQGTTERLEKIMARIDQGEGTLGKFVNDPSIHNQATEVMENVRGITARLEAGEGTLGRLSKDEKLYDDIRAALDQITTFVNDVEEGKGTLGRLAKDEQLYQNLNEVSSEVVKLIYDFRQNPRKFLTIKFELF